MATICFFDEVLTDKVAKGTQIRLEFGRSSYYGGESLMYLKIGEAGLILDEKTGRKLCDKMNNLATYLGNEKN